MEQLHSAIYGNLMWNSGPKHQGWNPTAVTAACMLTRWWWQTKGVAMREIWSSPRRSGGLDFTNIRTIPTSDTNYWKLVLQNAERCMMWKMILSTGPQPVVSFHLQVLLPVPWKKILCKTSSMCFWDNKWALSELILLYGRWRMLLLRWPSKLICYCCILLHW